MNIAIIPARGGSTRIPKKNIRDFHGIPIIAHSIEIAEDSELFDKIIVSTDSKEIADVAKEYGAKIHNRSEELSRDEVGTQEVVQDVIEGEYVTPDLVCCIYATAPLMSIKHLERGFDILRYYSETHFYAMSVGINTQADAGQFYWGWASAFSVGHPLIGMRTAMVPIDAERVCDINTEEDWKRAEAMYESLHNS